jgi:hypothetical protein
VDLDYKAVGNAGMQVVGRLITERDRDRALDGLGLDELPDGRRADDVVAGLDRRQFLLYDVRDEKRVRLLRSRWAMSYLRGPLSLLEMRPLLAGEGEASIGSPGAAMPETAGPAVGPEPSVAPGGTAGEDRPPMMGIGVPIRFSASAQGLLEPVLVIRSRVTIIRQSLGLDRTFEEIWSVPTGATGELDWEQARALEESPDLVDEPQPGTRFPAVAPSRLQASLAKAASAYISWRARRPVMVLASPGLKLVAEPGEGRDAFIERCLDAADRADDSRQERVRARFEKRIETLKRRLEREQDELDRDQAQLEARKAEEKLGVVEGIFSVLLGSRSIRSAAGKAASRARSVASKRRMSRRAADAVTESENEIERIGDEIEQLADEMQDEIDRIAAESEEKARQVEEVSIRPLKANVEILSMELAWGRRSL